MIQVKSIGSPRNRCQVSLANWIHLIRNPLPAFVLVILFGAEDNGKRAFLIHVGEENIAKVQRRLRRAYSRAMNSDRLRLNKAKMEVSRRVEDLMPSLDGAGLWSSILRYIPDGMSRYSLWKQDVCATVGYEDGVGDIDLTVLAPRDVNLGQHLVDWDIGLVPHLDIQGGRATDRRFGIPGIRKVLPPGSRLEVAESPEPEKGQVVVATSKNERLFLECAVHLPRSVARFVQRSKLRARFVSGDWTFVVPLSHGAEGGMSFKVPDASKALPLARLHASAQMLLAMQSSIEAATPLSFAAFCAGKRFGHGAISVSGLSASVIEWARAVDDAWALARYFSIETIVEEPPGGLARQRGALALARACVGLDSRRFKVTFRPGDEPPDPGSSYCVPFALTVGLGSYRIQLSAGLIGRVGLVRASTAQDDEYEIVSERFCTCFKQVLAPGEEAEMSVDDLRRYTADHHEDEVGILFVDF